MSLRSGEKTPKKDGAVFARAGLSDHPSPISSKKMRGGEPAAERWDSPRQAHEDDDIQVNILQI